MIAYVLCASFSSCRYMNACKKDCIQCDNEYQRRIRRAPDGELVPQHLPQTAAPLEHQPVEAGQRRSGHLVRGVTQIGMPTEYEYVTVMLCRNRA